MLKHRDFLDEVAERAELDDPDETKPMVESILAGVARRIDEPSRAQLADVLPAAMATLVVASTQEADRADLASFLATVASATETTPERARYVAQAVMSLVADESPEVAARLRDELPEEFDDLFAAPGDGPPPERAASAAMPGPTELTRDEVARVLEFLPGWTGDEHRLRRTVGLPPDLDTNVRDRIARVERDMSHHARVEDGPDGTTYVLWTHSVDAVTDLDVQLAMEITEIVEEAE